jgi:hypothetical protein
MLGGLALAVNLWAYARFVAAFRDADSAAGQRE